jgi:hypothetical protein
MNGSNGHILEQPFDVLVAVANTGGGAICVHGATVTTAFTLVLLGWGPGNKQGAGTRQRVFGRPRTMWHCKQLGIEEGGECKGEKQEREKRVVRV